MASNERVLLDEILKQRQEDSQTPLPSDEAFEIFSCEQILRDLDFSADEIAAGVVGGGDDGGLDGV